MAAELGRRDLLIVLLSGGASSLLPAPVAGVTLADKQRTTQELLRCGASIREINTVRKHLSRIKGGRLAELTEATVVTVILSDVLGDDLSAIASGPTAPDPTTYQEAVAILKRHRIWRAVPPASASASRPWMSRDSRVRLRNPAPRYFVESIILSSGTTMRPSRLWSAQPEKPVFEPSCIRRP